jgi:hypothetical protein
MQLLKDTLDDILMKINTIFVHKDFFEMPVLSQMI